jgi:hypothetical protein
LRKIVRAEIGIKDAVNTVKVMPLPSAVAACERVTDAGDVMTDAMVVPSAIPGPVIT